MQTSAFCCMLVDDFSDVNFVEFKRSLSADATPLTASISLT